MDIDDISVSVSAFFSRRLAFMLTRSMSRRVIREESVSPEELKKFYARRIDKRCIFVDTIYGHWDKFDLKSGSRFFFHSKWFVCSGIAAPFPMGNSIAFFSGQFYLLQVLIQIVQGIEVINPNFCNGAKRTKFKSALSCVL